MITPKNIILGAKQSLLTDGWITGMYVCGTGEHCAVGALRYAAGGEQIIDPYADVRDNWSHMVSEPDDYFEEYAAALFAVADQVDPEWRDDYSEDQDSYDWTTEDWVSIATDVVTGFNDTQSQRDFVIDAFEKAAETLIV